MKKYIFLLLLTLLPTLVMAQASGGQITRPSNKQQNVQNTGSKSSNNRSNVYREVYYESTLSVEERKVWEDEKAKAKERMRLLAYNLKVQGLEAGRNFYDGAARCNRKNDNAICFINKDGEILFVLPPSISDVRNFHNGFAVFSQRHNGSLKHGIIDKSGTVVVHAEYDMIEDFSEGLFRAKKGGKYGFINNNGNITIPFVYEDSKSCHEGLMTVMRNGKWGYIDKDGNLVIPFNYDLADIFSEGLAAVMKNGKWGYIDKSNNLKIPFFYWQAYPFQSGVGQVILDTDRIRTGFINNHGKYVIPLHNGNLGFYSDDLIAINGAYLDNLGKVQIRTKYDLCGDFSEGLAFVGKAYSVDKFKCGFINKKGQIVINFKYDGHVDSNPKFSEGLVCIWNNGTSGYVDKYGNSTFDFE